MYLYFKFQVCLDIVLADDAPFDICSCQVNGALLCSYIDHSQSCIYFTFSSDKLFFYYTFCILQKLICLHTYSSPLYMDYELIEARARFDEEYPDKVICIALI
jgi:hypothetical protein